MKILRALRSIVGHILAIALLIVAPAAAEASASYMIALPASMDSASAQAAMNAVMEVVARVPAGTRVQVFDGYHQQRICDMTIPDAPTPNARSVRLKKEIGAVREHLKRSQAAAGDRGGSPDTTCQLRVPRFLAMVAAMTGEADGGERPRIILLGSLYHRGDDPGSSFGPGSVASDAHPLAPSSETELGAADHKGCLTGVSIDWCYVGDDSAELERRAVIRFWSVYATELGATLTTCLPSAMLTVERSLTGATDPATNATIDRTDRVLEIRPVAASSRVVLGEPAGSTEPVLPAPEALRQSAEAIPAARAGTLIVAAVWTSVDGQADVDLWVRPVSGADELNFAHRTTAHGRYLRDIQRSRQDHTAAAWRTAWEGVELRDAGTVPEIWLDLYSNSGAAVEGMVRVRSNGRTTDVPFSFPGGNAGDRAASRGSRAQSSCWVRIDVTAHLAQAPSSSSR